MIEHYAIHSRVFKLKSDCMSNTSIARDVTALITSALERKAYKRLSSTDRKYEFRALWSCVIMLLFTIALIGVYVWGLCSGVSWGYLLFFVPALAFFGYICVLLASWARSKVIVAKDALDLSLCSGLKLSSARILWSEIEDIVNDGNKMTIVCHGSRKYDINTALFDTAMRPVVRYYWEELG